MIFCSITPIKYANLMYNNSIVMLLAHLSEKYPEYVELSKSNKNRYRIMDNSIIELGSSFSMEKLVKEAEKCEANEIILPDAYQDGEKTIKLVKESIQWLKKNNYLGKFYLMAVCHGKNEKEFEKCFQKLNKIKEIDVIGIPKVTCSWIKSRSNLSHIYLKTKKELHFLGVWDSLSEIINLPSNIKQRIRSVDSCLPSVLTIQNKKLSDSRNGTINLETADMDVNKYKETIKILNSLL